MLSEEVWYHIALVKHADKIYIYFEGERIYIYDGMTTVPDGLFSIGGQETYWNGNMTIDELRISSMARYTDDFYTTSDCEFSVDSDTYALYHFNDGTPSQFATDASSNGHHLRLGTSPEVDDSDPDWIIDGIVPTEVQIIGDTIICPSAPAISFSSEVIGNAVDYSWEINGDVQITSGQGSASIVVAPTIINHNIAPVELCLTIDAGCGLNIEDSQTIQFQTIEEIPLINIPQQTLCASDNSISLSTNQNNSVGNWFGDGINDNTFYPEIAGLGVHEIYFLPNAEACTIGIFSIEVYECDCAGTPNGSFLVDDCGECLEITDPNFNRLCKINIPNAFSPNGDGINDKFKVLKNPAINAQVIRYLIYNRWGQ